MRTSGKCVKKKFSYIAFLLTALQRKEGIYVVSDCLFDSFAQKALVLDMFTDQTDAQGQTEVKNMKAKVHGSHCFCSSLSTQNSTENQSDINSFVGK